MRGHGRSPGRCRFVGADKMSELIESVDWGADLLHMQNAVDRLINWQTCEFYNDHDYMASCHFLNKTLCALIKTSHMESWR